MGIETEDFISYSNYDVHIYYVDMPCSVASNIVENPDGSFTLYLNSRMTYERNIKGYLHEIKHLKNDDLNNCYNIQHTELTVRGT